MSKNSISIEQIRMACGHCEELIQAGVTENLAIRTLEIFTDIYAKLSQENGNASPHHVNQVPKKQWSVKAKEKIAADPHLKPKDGLRVEHGTPRRAFARMALKLYKKEQLNDENMRELVHQHWKLAVITIEEDQKLNQAARSKKFDTPDERWASVGITF
ncbi:hypothetical protein [Methylomonas fluvii]|uniref:Uncharacterized protein n=1 Tax=Methylomonas fluvii TaxID=1854564 RepID=A0ABR9D931_9GAMM|nr:hypothetical protein [Methylomonas fluvii]MBD9359316.1 hypothetical protein [Methylomonas fluvii]